MKKDLQDAVSDTFEGDGTNLWMTVLSETYNATTFRLPGNKNLVILGDIESGKSTVLAKWLEAEEVKRGSQLEYHFVNIRDEQSEDSTRLGVWILTGSVECASLLKFAINEENFENTTVLLTVSMSSPWSLVASLEKWIAVVRTHVDSLKLKPNVLKDAQARIARKASGLPMNSDAWGQHHAGDAHTNEHSGENDDVSSQPLPEATVSENVGLPIIVCVTKVDSIAQLEKDYDFKEEHWDFVQMHLRRFCLQYGASLIYVSSKDNKKSERLFSYLKHEMYGFKFSNQPSVLEKDDVFVPAGWDTEKKIDALQESFTTINLSDSYDSVVKKPTTLKRAESTPQIQAFTREADVTVDEELVFLSKIQTLLSKHQPPATAAPTAALSTSSNTGKTGDAQNLAPTKTPAVASAPVTAPEQQQQATGRQSGQGLTSPLSVAAPQTGSPVLGGVGLPRRPGQTSGAGGQPPSNEVVLSNFFNSLLNKKPSAAMKTTSPASPSSHHRPQPPPGPDQSQA